jgi:trans-aconitate 2-methyltransferase
MAWDPQRYHQFQSERFAPFEDLLKLIRVKPGLRVIDLGCGTGELTRRLADHLPESETLGVDSSPQMLQKAQSQARPGLRFERGDIAEVAAASRGKFDLVFSHAAIQWVDDHESLIPMLLEMLKPGGQVAIQQPANHNHPSYRMMSEIAAEEPFKTALNGWLRVWPVLKVERYADLLFANGASEINVFEKIYPHVLKDADAIADWNSGTALLPYFERLSPEMKSAYDAEYRKLLRAMYPELPVFYGFKRILFAGVLSKND